MASYIARRLLILIPTLFIVSLLVFFLAHWIPGDKITVMMIRDPDQVLDRPALEKVLGLDALPIVQYGRWMGVIPQVDGNFSGVFQGNLGTSWWRQMSVIKLVTLKWPVTLELGLMALIVAQLIALPIGVYSALRQDSWGDYIGRSFAILCIAVPGFWVGTLIVVFPAIWWGHMPPIILIPFTEDPIGNLGMFIIPAIVLGMDMAGSTMRMTRTMMLEVLRQDYIRTAWAKGLREKVVVTRHALKNALIPVVTIIGLQVPILIGGTVIIEQIFCLPGMGRLIIEATMERDEPLICGAALFFAIGLVLINLITDLTYGFLDPRVHYR